MNMACIDVRTRMLISLAVAVFKDIESGFRYLNSDYKAFLNYGSVSLPCTQQLEW